jgi:hypothetical protein
MRFHAFWLSVVPLFNEGALSRNTEHPVVVHHVLNPPHPDQYQHKAQHVDGSGPRRLLQHERRANSTSVGAAASKTSSRRTIATFGAPKKVSALTPEQEEAYTKGYTMQFAGLASNGIEPKDTMDEKANHCMIAGGASETGGGSGGGGIALTWGPCPHFVQKNKFGVPTGDAKKPDPNQLFQFTIDGKVRHVATGRCLRRVVCGVDPGPLGPERPYVYDLGFCDEKGVTKIQIWESRANQAALIMPLGNALNAVEGTCIACGPFMMQQVCKGPCDTVEVTSGWTKMPSAYNIKKESQDRSYLRFGPYEDGLCNSFVKDQEAMASWWYFHKYDIPKPPAPK